ncbi:type VII secretion protein EccB [Actinophytocola oryzae]|uniref:Type VII secretion protein EccB n=1 Tax=Actinophytocola oryzae TaxID=502181 RepID=A0A4R7UWI2_9PSEU|nr:type VII secretion protein EccB [Actinophytocola oryzae]TDV38611.1 type VII secretion protein EccB [Actinophytocola oryzae]
MQSRRDQVHAYFFVVGRLVSALTHGRPDILEPPNRRFSTAGIIGVLLTVVLVGAFWIIGIYAPTTSTTWQQPGTIIMDEDTGARYLYLDGELRPVLNYTSARLAVGSDGSGAVEQVSAKSLAGTPVGATIGIPGAPDAPPAAGSMRSGPWTVCLGLPDDTRASPSVTLMMTGETGRKLDARQGILVSGPNGSQYLLWQGHRYRFAGDVAARALGYGGVAPLAVPASWLSPIPVGRDITVPVIAGTGSRGPVIDGEPTLIGQLYKVHNPATNGDETYVVREDGLSRLNRTTEALLLSAPSTKDAYPDGDVHVIPVQPGSLADVPVSGRTDLVSGYPSPPPALVNGSLDSGASPCAHFALSAEGKAPVTTFTTMPTAAITLRAVETPSDGSTVDHLAIPKGTGVLAGDLPTTGARTGAVYLITDLGVKFPLLDESVAETLGYDQNAAVDVPNQLLALLPTGPVLSQAAALTPRPAATE